ncbi:MAG TPA: POTRA domain-containing protein [Pyrinomonadaceae bacterium]|nr:POTRA domain-containing protein [Pyrinomonadaceae bacterium]
MIERPRPRIIPLLLLAIIAVSPVHAQQSEIKIAKIEFEGLQRLPVDEVLAVTKLKTGTVFSVTEVDEAGQRLMDTGLFAKVGYKTVTTRNNVTIIFQLDETKSTQSPVLFDNLVWFTDEELYIAIKREVPSFGGMAPDNGAMTDVIKQALQKLLDEKQIKGTIEYAAWQTGVSTGKQEHVFSVTGVPIPICKITFPGAKNVSEEMLAKSSSELLHADYSHKSAVAFGSFILYPLYREAGQWRAKFGNPTVKLETSENCNGVSLSIPVDEGPVYLWSKAEWSGNEALTATALDDALGFKPGDVLKGSKLEKGLIALRHAYARIGRLDASANPIPTFDDAASRVTFKFEIKDGPRFTMGNLSVKGLDEAGVQIIQDAWKLRRSEVFDASYIDQFLRVDGREALRRLSIRWQEVGKSLPRVEQTVKKNEQSLTADVTLEFRE